MAKKEKQYIAIFHRHFVESISLSPNVIDKCMKSWRKDQVVRSAQDIERLSLTNAPISVYVESFKKFKEKKQDIASQIEVEDEEIEDEITSDDDEETIEERVN